MSPREIDLERIRWVESDIGLARRFAAAAHRDQWYVKDEVPYIVHCAEVAELVVGQTSHAPAIAAAWLHDVLEDQPMFSYSHLERLFGAEVARLVFLLSDPPIPDRRTRKNLALLAISSDSTAVLVKLCDRIANVRGCVRYENRKKFEMYKEAQPYFSAILQQEGKHLALWRKLAEELNTTW